jgi:hypothetical protein
MGGRKPHSVRKVLGTNLGQTSIERKELKEAIHERNPKNIAQKTLSAFEKSDFAISNLTKALDMFEVAQKIKGKDLSSEELKVKVSNDWAIVKKQKAIKIEPEIERIFVDSALKLLKRRGRK